MYAHCEGVERILPDRSKSSSSSRWGFFLFYLFIFYTMSFHTQNSTIRNEWLVWNFVLLLLLLLLQLLFKKNLCRLFNLSVAPATTTRKWTFKGTLRYYCCFIYFLLALLQRMERMYLINIECLDESFDLLQIWDFRYKLLWNCFLYSYKIQIIDSGSQ